jgi:hypothetical protein
MGRRAQAARDILQEQLARAEINIADAADKDEAAAMVFEYAEAARQGSARRNLRMLAQIIAGELATPPIFASEYLRWSHILADLSRQEIIALAKLHQVHQMPDYFVGDQKQWNEIEARVLLDLQQQGVVSTKIELHSILGALQRTGLVVYSAGGFGGAWHLPSPRLDALLKLVDIEAALAEPDR